MATVAVQFTPTHDVLNATSLHRRTRLLCRACLDHHRDRFRSCSSKSCEQILGVLLSSRGSRGKEIRGLQQCGTTVALLSRSFGELFGGRERRSWCASASAKAVHPASELQSAEELRAQLEALQHEAEQVRSKANSARLRFMRLTRVVEQLRQHAAMDVRMGKEDSARALLLEKQKVMKALEAARQRAELLEQLAGKLNVVVRQRPAMPPHGKKKPSKRGGKGGGSSSRSGGSGSGDASNSQLDLTFSTEWKAIGHEMVEIVYVEAPQLKRVEVVESSAPTTQPWLRKCVNDAHEDWKTHLPPGVQAEHFRARFIPEAATRFSDVGIGKGLTVIELDPGHVDKGFVAHLAATSHEAMMQKENNRVFKN